MGKTLSTIMTKNNDDVNDHDHDIIIKAIFVVATNTISSKKFNSKTIKTKI